MRENVQSNHLRASLGQIFLSYQQVAGHCRNIKNENLATSKLIEIFFFIFERVFFWFLYNLTTKVFSYWITLKIEFESLYFVKQKKLIIPMYIFCQGSVWAYSPCQSIIFEVSPGFEGEKPPERGTGMIHGNQHAKLWNNLSCKYYCQKEIERTKMYIFELKGRLKGGTGMIQVNPQAK